MVSDSGMYCHLAVELVTADGSDVISSGIEEQVVDQLLSRLNKRRLTGTDLLIYFFEGFNGRVCSVSGCKVFALILFDGSNKSCVLTEQLIDILSVGKTQSADEHSKRHLTVLINAHEKNAVDIALILEPCASVRDYLCGICLLTRLIYLG